MKFAIARGGYIVTADEDGYAHLNSKIVAKIDVNDYHDGLLTTLIEQANMLHESLQERQG